MKKILILVTALLTANYCWTANFSGKKSEKYNAVVKLPHDQFDKIKRKLAPHMNTTHTAAAKTICCLTDRIPLSTKAVEGTQTGTILPVDATLDNTFLSSLFTQAAQAEHQLFFVILETTDNFNACVVEKFNNTTNSIWYRIYYGQEGYTLGQWLESTSSTNDSDSLSIQFGKGRQLNRVQLAAFFRAIIKNPTEYTCVPYKLATENFDYPTLTEGTATGVATTAAAAIATTGTNYAPTAQDDKGTSTCCALQ